MRGVSACTLRHTRSRLRGGGGGAGERGRAPAQGTWNQSPNMSCSGWVCARRQGPQGAVGKAGSGQGADVHVNPLDRGARTSTYGQPIRFESSSIPKP